MPKPTILASRRPSIRSLQFAALNENQIVHSMFQSGICGNYRYFSHISWLQQQSCDQSSREQMAIRQRSSLWAIVEEARMPIFIMWAVPAVIVLGGVSYYLIRVVQ